MLNLFKNNLHAKINNIFLWKKSYFQNKTIISEKCGIFLIIKNMLKAWLNRRQLDSHTSAFYLLQYHVK